MMNNIQPTVSKNIDPSDLLVIELCGEILVYVLDPIMN